MPDGKPIESLTDNELCARLLELKRKGDLNKATLKDLQAHVDILKARRDAEVALVELEKISKQADETLSVSAAAAITVFLLLAGSHQLPRATVSGPPRVVQNIIWFVLPRRIRDAVMGDAEEAFRQSLARGYSRRAASFDYCKEAIFAVLFAMWSPIQTLLGSFWKSS